MKSSKWIGFVAAGLAAGLVLGSIGVATAVTKSADTTSSKTASSTVTTTAPDDAHRGPGGHGGTSPDGMQPGFGGFGDIAEALANLTDLSVTEIEEKRADGTSYAAIAEAEGVSTDELVAETVKIEQKECDTAEKDGTLTSAEADEIMDGIEERLQTAIDSTEQMHRGHGGPPPASASDSDSASEPDSSATTQQ